MISIFKRLAHIETMEKDDLTSVFLRSTLLLLESAALHAVDYDRNALTEFQNGIREISRTLGRTSDPPSVLVLVGDAIKSIESHNRGAEKSIRQHREEMQSMITMMSQALLRIASKSDQAGENLRTIGKELQDASQLESIRAIKGNMKVSLKCLCDEVERQESVSRDIKTEVQALEKEHPARYELDPETGLPVRASAERHVALNADGTRKIYVLAVHLDRLEMINARFGFEEGNKMLAFFGKSLVQRLSKGDRLFRWRGPCFAVVLERSYGPDVVRAEAAKMLSARVEYTVEVGTRSILFSLSSAWTLIPILKVADAATFAAKVDTFTSEQHRTATVGKS